MYLVEEFDHILDINLKGAFLVAQAVGKQMIAQGDGRDNRQHRLTELVCSAERNPALRDEQPG